MSQASTLIQAGGGDGAVFLTHVVCLAQPGGEILVVFAQFGQHIQRPDILATIVEDVRAADAPDGARDVLGGRRLEVGRRVDGAAF